MWCQKRERLILASQSCYIHNIAFPSFISSLCPDRTLAQSAVQNDWVAAAASGLRERDMLKSLQRSGGSLESGRILDKVTDDNERPEGASRHTTAQSQARSSQAGRAHAQNRRGLVVPYGITTMEFTCRCARRNSTEGHIVGDEQRTSMGVA